MNKENREVIRKINLEDLKKISFTEEDKNDQKEFLEFSRHSNERYGNGGNCTCNRCSA